MILSLFSTPQTLFIIGKGHGKTRDYFQQDVLVSVGYKQYVKKKKRKDRECAEIVVFCEIKGYFKKTINGWWSYQAVVLGNFETYTPIA